MPSRLPDPAFWTRYHDELSVASDFRDPIVAHRKWATPSSCQSTHHMKLFILRMLGIACLIVSGTCFSLSLKSSGIFTSTTQHTRDYDELEAIDPVQDLGTVNQGEILSSQFQLFNGSRSPIRITDVRAGCDCTNARVASTHLEPGSGTTLTCQWNTTAKRKRTYTDILIYYESDKPNDSTTLAVRMTANVIPDYYNQPDTLQFESSIKSERVVELTAGNLKDLRITGSYTTHTAFQAKVIPGLSQVCVSFDPIAWSNERARAFLIISTNSTIEPERRIELIVVSNGRDASH